MIVVDTNIIFAAFVNSEVSDAVERLRKLDEDWVAPALWCSELRNALVRYLRTGRLTIDEAMLVQDGAEAMMAGQAREVNSHDVLRLAESSACTAYDCEFVALAVELGIPLLTFDKQVLREFPDIAVRPD